MDEKEDIYSVGKPYQLFYMSKKMIHALAGLTKDLEDPIYLKPSEKSRFAGAGALRFLENHIFRYHKNVWEGEQKNCSCSLQPFAVGRDE